MKVIIKQVGKPHEVRFVNTDKLTEVSTASLPDELSDMELFGFDSEEFPYGLYGTLMLPHSKSVVAGSFVIIGVDEDGERWNLSDEQIERAEKYLAENEINEKLELGTVYGLMYDMLENEHLYKLKVEADKKKTGAEM